MTNIDQKIKELNTQVVDYLETLCLGYKIDDNHNIFTRIFAPVAVYNYERIGDSGVGYVKKHAGSLNDCKRWIVKNLNIVDAPKLIEEENKRRENNLKNYKNQIQKLKGNDHNLNSWY